MTRQNPATVTVAGVLCLVLAGASLAATRASTSRTSSGAAAATPPTRQAAEATSPAARPTWTPLFPSGEGRSYVVISIDGGMLSHHGTVVLKRGIDFAARQGAAAVVLHLDTPGGLVSVMLDMRDALIESPLPTISFVRQAYSAGSLLALATDRIYMQRPLAEIGDAIPIQLSIGQPEEIKGDMREKILAPLRNEFRSTARAKQHPEELAVGMVDVDLEIPGLKPKGKILVLDGPAAVREGLAVKEVDTLEQAVANEGLAGAQRINYEMTTADRLASLLSTPLMNVLLIAIAIGAIVLEVKTPGFGLGGIAAIVALFLFFWANWYANLAHWMEIVLFLVGVGLVAAELFIPGHGVLGIAGVACIVVSVFLAMFRFPPKGFAFDSARLQYAVQNLAWALAAGMVAMFFVVGAIRHSRLWQKVSLGNEMATSKGFTGLPDLSAQLGREGVVVTDLRPVGTVRIGHQRFDAITQGDFLERGATVRVVGADGAQLVVEKEIV